MTIEGLPVDSYKDAVPYLRRPFTPAAVKFKVQATWPKDNPTDGLVVAYIDQRLASERLNMVCPHLWQDAYEPTAQGLMWCHLTVDGITRRDVGEGQGKGLVSDALKRAAVKFGVGVSLYAVPKSFVSVARQEAKQKRTGKGVTIELTAKGESMIRAAYGKWLETHGSKVFGEPLDHGDVEGAQGDAETDDDAVVPTPSQSGRSDIPGDATDLRGPSEVPAPAPVEDRKAEDFRRSLAVEMKRQGLSDTVGAFRDYLAGVGIEAKDVASREKRWEFIKALSASDAVKLEQALLKSGRPTLEDAIDAGDVELGEAA